MAVSEAEVGATEAEVIVEAASTVKEEDDTGADWLLELLVLLEEEDEEASVSSVVFEGFVRCLWEVVADAVKV